MPFLNVPLPQNTNGRQSNGLMEMKKKLAELNSLLLTAPPRIPAPFPAAHVAGLCGNAELLWFPTGVPLQPCAHTVNHYHKMLN